MTTLVLGAGGFLGTYLTEEFKKREVEMVLHFKTMTNEFKSFLPKKALVHDLMDESDVIEVLKDLNVTHVINCIALADLKACESNLESSNWLNSELPRILAKECQRRNLHFTHISTEAVYGRHNKLKNENSLCYPESEYARSKLLGENAVIEENPKSLILRVNFFGHSSKKPSIFDFFFTNAIHGRKAPGYSNFFFNPLYVKDTSRYVLELSNRSYSGIVNLASPHVLSKLEFGRLIYRAVGQPIENVYDVPYQDENNPRNSYDATMSSRKMMQFGFQPMSVYEGIEDSINELSRIGVFND